jgi:SAM-dependent methyltransferase
VEAGLAYTEGVLSVCDLPYARFPRLEHDGRIASDPIVSITHSATTDPDPRHVTLAVDSAASLGDVAAATARAGLYCQILNHPDLNLATLEDAVLALPGRRSDLTCAEVADWWAATHRRDQLQVRTIADTQECLTLAVDSISPLRDLALSVRAAGDVRGVEVDGESADWEPSRHGGARVRVDVSPGRPAVVLLDRRRPARYAEVEQAIPHEIAAEIRIDPDYHLARISNLSEVVANYGGRDLAASSLIDVGCGFGPFPLALRLCERVTRIVGIDLDPDYLRTAREVARELAIDGVEFVAPDADAVHRLEAAADLAILVNSLDALPTTEVALKVLQNVHELLRPGGCLAVLTPGPAAERRAIRMPSRLKDDRTHMSPAVRQGHRALTLTPTPTELARLVLDAGFREPVVVDAYRLVPVNPDGYDKPAYYLLASKRDR